MNNVVLIGFMGSGKSTVGKKLAEELKIEWLDMDNEIEKREGKLVNEIFSEYGEAYFRELESKYINELLTVEKKVISTGGGVVLKVENIAILKKIGMVIFLHVDPSQIIERLEEDSTRPLLQGENIEEKVANLLEQRDPLYLSAADIIIQTTGKSVDLVVEEIISLL